MNSASLRERILVVDDAAETLEVFQRNLSWRGYDVRTAISVEEALRLLEMEHVDVVITDYKMPQVSGLDLVRHVRENLKDTEVIMVTGYATVEGAVRAMKTGAEEYLSKPVTEDELAGAVQRALEKLRLRRAGAMDHPGELRRDFGLIGESDGVRKVRADVVKAAASSATTLITGESGTGKELVARAIHYNGARSSAAFVPINCGGIPEGLLESELFGHLKGAFTGATETRAGFFQTADGGTIFLDEISDTSLSMQAKLLRVLQSKEVCMVGSTQPRTVDVRIVAATNKDLQALVRKGLFREDLFFRINVIGIAVPPLRERGDDIILLARHFAAKFSAELGKPEPRFSDGVLQALKNSMWPGNVRELENLIQRLIVMTDAKEIELPDLPSLMRFVAGKGPRALRSLAEVEEEHIRLVMSSVGGNKTQAAQVLGMDRKTLREKMKQYAMHDTAPADLPSPES